VFHGWIEPLAQHGAHAVLAGRENDDLSVRAAAASAHHASDALLRQIIQLADNSKDLARAPARLDAAEHHLDARFSGLVDALDVAAVDADNHRFGRSSCWLGICYFRAQLVVDRLPDGTQSIACGRMVERGDVGQESPQDRGCLSVRHLSTQADLQLMQLWQDAPRQRSRHR